MRTRIPLRFLGGLAILLGVGVGFLSLQMHMLLLPPEIPAATSAPVPVTISPGASSKDVAVVLQEASLVRSALLFRYYAMYRGLDQGLQAGTYHFRRGMTSAELLQALAAGEVFRPTVTVTIPEGLTLEQIDAVLAEVGLVNEADFMSAAAAAVPVLGRQLPGQRHALEGFLFPDTYEFDAQSSVETIINRLQQRLMDVFDEDLRQRARQLGFDVHQIITLASLIEREVRVPAERELVSAVLHNRLRMRMPLQVDATVLYALDRHQRIVLYRDLEVDSPYNTYRVADLPPGPIASPGRAALLAALYPADVAYLYYVAREDGSGGHYFAKTFGEHTENIRRARARRGRRNP